MTIGQTRTNQKPPGDPGTRRAGVSRLSAVLALIVLMTGFAARVTRGQAPDAAQSGGGVSYPHFKDTANGRLLDAIITGQSARPLPGGAVQLQDFVLTGFRDGLTNEVRVIAQAPECRVDVNKGIAGDPGPIQIFTPSTNLFVQGTGFFCAESNQVLVLSNQVESRIVKSMLHASFISAPNTSTPAQAGQLLKIFSDRAQFDYRSNLVNYAGNVRVDDPQFHMVSPFLFIQFTNNEAVAEIRAWENVAVTLTNKGIATGKTGAYFQSNGTQLLELAGGAEWHNGPQEAKSAKFTYDPDRHFLTADGEVRVRWPDSGTNGAGPQPFREMFADYATLQMTPDGQIVDSMTAKGNVIIVNQADHSRAMAAQAVYNRTNDLFELTGDADWWNDQMQVWGDSLAMAPTNQVYHARGNARLKLHLSGAGTDGRSTNQWLDITSDDIVKETNLVTFRGTVRGRLLEGDQMLDTLTTALLLVSLDSSNQIQNVVARGDVHAESAVDAAGVKRTISCSVLTARHWPNTSLWQSVLAEDHVVMEETGSGPAAAVNHLTADRVTAYFSDVTNQLQSAVAEGSVVFRQTKTGQSLRATGERGVYAVEPDEQVELTGHPWAQNDKNAITDADKLVWHVQSGRLEVYGHYHITSASNAVGGEAKLTGTAP